jgi:peptidoglycan/xylan/chitin deacetylase (PgdA/CDA1 family)
MRLGLADARRAVPLAASAVATSRALLGARPKVVGAVALAYHDVEPEPSTFYSISPEDLRRQLGDLLELGVRFVTARELVSALRAGEPIDGLGVVTFDDGLEGLHHHALQVLLDLDVPATAFVVSGNQGSAAPWWRGAGRTLSVEELREVMAAGICVESHAQTHTSLPLLDDERLTEELVRSRADIEELLGVRPSLLAYPNGHFDRRVRAAAVDAGFEAAFTFLPGRILPTSDPFRLPRLPMGVWHTRRKLTFDVARSPGSFHDQEPDEKHD